MIMISLSPNHEPMSLSLKETIETNKDIKFMLTILTEDKSYEKILKIISEFESVWDIWYTSS